MNISKKRWAYFWTYRPRETWLDKCLKSLVSEHLLTSNIVNGRKDSSKPNNSPFTKFIDPFEVNSDWKSLTDWYGKSQECFLTHWLAIKGIIFLTETIYSNIFRCKYLRNEKYFLHIFFEISKFTFNFEHFVKKDDLHSWCIF